MLLRALRRAARLVSHATVLFATSVASWLLVLAFAVWGFAYLWQCVVVLLAPGVPIVQSYEAESGPHAIRLDGVSVDPWTRKIVAASATLSDKNGQNVATARRIVVSHRAGVWSIGANSLAARVVRHSDGNFELGRLAPKGPKGGEGPALRMSVDSAVVAYEDQTASGPLRRFFQLRGLTWYQHGDDGAGSARVAWRDSIGMPVAVQTGAQNRWWVRLEPRGTDVAGLLPAFERYADPRLIKNWQGWRSDRLILDGSLEASQGLGTVPVVHGDIAYRTKDLEIGNGLRDMDLSGTWVGGLELANATVAGSVGTKRLALEGRLRLDPDIRFNGSADVSVPDQDSLSSVPGLSLPRGFGFQGAKLKGRLAFGPRGGQFSSQANLGSVRANGQVLSAVDGTLAYDGTRVRADVKSARWQGAKVSGALVVTGEKGEIAGALRAERVDIRKFAAAQGMNASGTADLVAVVSGTVQSPSIDATATGRGQFVFNDEQFVADQFEAAFSYKSDKVQIRRAIASGALGVMAADGTLDVRRQTMALHVRTGAVPLAKLGAEGGTGYFVGRMTGRFSAPQFIGDAEVYGLQVGGRDLPHVRSAVNLKSGLLSLTKVQAIAGSSVATGAFEVNLNDRTVKGGAESFALNANELLGPDFSGSIVLDQLRVSGSLESPDVTASVRTDRLTAVGVTVEKAQASLEFRKGRARFDSVVASLGGGQVTGKAGWNQETESGTAEVAWRSLDLAKVPFDLQGVTIDGSTEGSGVFAFDRSGLTRASASAGLDKVELRATPIGSGSLTAEFDGRNWAAKGEIGSIDRYFSLENAVYDQVEDRIQAKALALNIPLGDVLKFANAEVDDFSFELRDALAATEGSASGTFQLEGPLKAPDISELTLEVKDVSLRETAVGTIALAAKRLSGDWTLSEATWNSRTSTLSASGSFSHDEVVNATLDLSKFDLSLINLFNPETPRITGSLDLTAVVEGPLDDLRGTMSGGLAVDAVEGANGQSQIGASVVLSEATLAGGMIDASGLASMRGFTGDLSARLPFSFEPGLSSKAVSVRADLVERPLVDFANDLKEIDFARSSGSVRGSLVVSGTYDAPEFATDITLVAQTLEFKSGQTGFRDLVAELEQDRNTVTLTASATGSHGGTVAADVKVAMDSLAEALADPEKFKSSASTTGTVRANGFLAEVKLPSTNEVSRALIDGTLTVSGPLLAPVFGGQIGLQNGILTIPTEFVQSAGSEATVDPRFDNLVIIVGPGTKVAAANVDLRLSGTGSLNGTLGSPEARLPLKVEAGTIKLPTTRLSIEPGGTIGLRMDTLGGVTTPRTELDLRATGRVTVRRFSGRYESTEVLVSVRGDLLRQDGLTYSASSDIPDISQEELLAALGQRGLIEAWANSALGGRFDSEVLRETLYGVALPGLAQGTLDKLASELGLDYIALEYNPFDEFVLSIGKTLTKGLTLVAARQLKQTQSEAQKYELKLTYRPPLKDQVLSRFLVSFGLNERSRWRIGIDWGRRM